MITPGITHLTIRVYGILIVREAVLLSREIVRGQAYTKFPGGGLELGEGLRDCLVREFREEANVVVAPGEHFYTTDHFVRSAFDPSTQVLSIYYRLSCPEAARIEVKDAAQPQQLHAEGEQILFWQPLKTLRPTHLDLPIDQIVARMLVDAAAFDQRDCR